MDRNKPHLFLKNRAQFISYTYPGVVIDPFSVPNRIRSKHGKKLRGELSSIQNEADELSKKREEIGLQKQRGITVEIEGVPGYELRKISLDNSIFQLLSVHTKKINGKILEIAVVFIPDGSLSKFIKKIDEYLKLNNKKSGLPNNNNLIASIETIRKAALDSLWTDAPSLFPKNDLPVWWEVWLATRQDLEEDVLDFFSINAKAFNLNIRPGSIKFPERYVILVNGRKSDLAASFDMLNCISELRKPKGTAHFFITAPQSEQVQWSHELIERLITPPEDSPAVCLLDTGVNHGHPLIEQFISEDCILSVKTDWDGSDSNGHGSGMAGIALFGDLFEKLIDTQDIPILHFLESVKIFETGNDYEPDLYGDITSRAVSKVELIRPDRNRVFNLTVTTEHGMDRGRPSSWSAALDSISSGYMDNDFRLFVISAGNLPTSEINNYPNCNFDAEIEDPGQSYNALTIGAYTEKTQLDQDETTQFSPIAPSGNLSPYSRTSLKWQHDWPYKPDLVMEGGNAATDEQGFVSQLDSLMLLTTSHQHSNNHFTITGMSSAATTLVSSMGAKIISKYPTLWPETIRGLLVHTAEYTELMKKTLPSKPQKSDKQKLLRTYGYGVPNEARAIYSANNVLHLIAEEKIQPFHEVTTGRTTANHLNFYSLPWPIEELRKLGGEEVELRITLSYFIEPNPARRGFKNRFQYHSHGLRFKLKRPYEDLKTFRARINKDDQNEDYESSESTEAGNWFYGDAIRTRGSLHHDRWLGTAIDLAERNAIAVVPVGGWWKDRKSEDRGNRDARYSLIVSIHTKNSDIYTEVEQKIKTDILI
ncbi:S8 family peptidase [Leptospira alexanderi]|uniref:Peptidase, S8/S53 family n=1 Tax=Leptospira alexanderi serovar Manhao 3 str. L 60 TaxID=1049759 RepID=V6I4A9_9LEPT|nr:S8 family peptidase [Leptospira alexanderi]EQA64617.1 peptidase, S8/S53 family [Leptospira alexanderi serovar Manhao 3 str. L 60]